MDSEINKMCQQKITTVMLGREGLAIREALPAGTTAQATVLLGSRSALAAAL
jgi:hypothetical protein